VRLKNLLGKKDQKTVQKLRLYDIDPDIKKIRVWLSFLGGGKNHYRFPQQIHRKKPKARFQRYPHVMHRLSTGYPQIDFT